MIAYLDPDGTLADENEKQHRRTLDLHVRADGTGRIIGELTPETAQAWKTILDALSEPDPEADDQQPDPRTATQRRHDAFLDAGQRLLGSGTLPDCGGVPVSIIITMSAEQMETGRGYARTEHGDLLPVSTVLRMGDQAEIITTVLNTEGGIVSYGVTRRLATPAMRRALTARDGGCSFPGCTAPATWSQAHHIIPWSQGGRTDLDNLTLVCGHHHRTFEKHGWTCTMRDGVPNGPHHPGSTPTRRPDSTSQNMTRRSATPCYRVTDPLQRRTPRAGPYLTGRRPGAGSATPDQASPDAAHLGCGARTAGASPTTEPAPPAEAGRRSGSRNSTPDSAPGHRSVRQHLPWQRLSSAGAASLAVRPCSDHRSPQCEISDGRLRSREPVKATTDGAARCG